MLHRPSLSRLAVLAFALITPCVGHSAPQAASTQTSEDQLFQAYTQYYFVRRDLDFALEMTLRESFLTWLYEGINREAAERSRENPTGTLKAISPPELEGFDEESYAYPDSLDEAPLRIRYMAWEKYQRTEFNHKYLLARLIKDRLIQSSTPEQRRRMFRADLESTFYAYRDGDYRDAILRFDELLDSYGYTDVADIAFYRAESYLALQMLDQAQADYQFVAERSDDPKLRRQSLERLISIAGDRGATGKLIKLWAQYEAEVQTKDNGYWTTADIAGRCLMAAEEWTAARDILAQVPESSPQYQSAALRTADCQTALLNLDDAVSRYNALLNPKDKKLALSKEMKAEAELKLGYIEYLRGNFDLAYLKLSGIKAEGDVGERAEIGSIWALYRLSAYPQVVIRAENFIANHPQSQYLYEARCLIGFSDELIGQSGGALDNYKIVMSALDDRQDFHDFNFELQAISENLSRLQQLEGAIFIEGERDFFPEYIEIHKRLGQLMDGVRFARALKSTPFLKEVLKEQRELYNLFAQQGDLEKRIYDAQDLKLFDQYQGIIGDLRDIGAQLTAGTRYYMKQKSLIQREEDRRYESQMSDSLRSQLEREWKATREAIALVNQYLNDAGGEDAAAMVELAGVEIHLAGIQDGILRVQTDLRKFGQDIVTSNLDDWSDFAYQRYTYGGINFDYLYSHENRLGELDEYIQSINSLLQKRAKERADTLRLAPELALAGKAGDPPYIAPPIPLWGSKPAAPAEAAGEEGSGEDETSVIEETPAVEEMEETPAVEPEMTPEVSPSGMEPAPEKAPAPEEPAPPQKIEPPPEESPPTGDIVPTGEERTAPVMEPETAPPDSIEKQTETPPESGSNQPQSGPAAP